MRIDPILMSHDDLGVAAFRIETACAKTLGFATDLGRTTDTLTDHLAGVGVLAIESNYCPVLQADSDRPAFLKHRIMGGAGHLSNDECAKAVHAIAPATTVVLLHLSRQCNTPELAARAHAGIRWDLTISSQTEPTPWIPLTESRAGAADHESKPTVSVPSHRQGMLFRRPVEALPMARERPRRQSSTAQERVSVRPAARARKSKAREPRPAGTLQRFTRAVFGITRTITVDGVKYRERSRVSLERSLGPRGKGSKAYEVRFPAGRAMTINATETRRYADLMTVPTLSALTSVRRHIRPGERVLVLGAGTGAIPDLVARWTGPNGGVVALEHDHESVRFARRRYAPPSTSLERGGPELLAGELSGAFDSVIVDQGYLFACESASKAWDEIWRVVAETGKVIHAGGNGDHPASAPRVPADAAMRCEPVDTPAGTVPISVLTRILVDPPY